MNDECSKVVAIAPLHPMENEILIQELNRMEQVFLMSGTGIMPEDKPEDYIVRGLMELKRYLI